MGSCAPQRWSHLQAQGTDSLLVSAIGRNWKGKTSVLLYAVSIAVAFVIPWLADAIFVAVAVMWLVPNRRIENLIVATDES